MGESLDELRARIDALDETIVAALSERFALARQAAAHKGADVQDPVREAAVLRRVERLAEELGGDATAVRSSYDRILEVSRELQSSAQRRAAR